MALLSNNPVWVDVDCVGESGAKYFGRFCLKPMLTHRERSDAARLAAVYTRGITDEAISAFLTTLAHVKFHIVESDASWWSDGGLDMYDELPVYEIVKKIKELQKPAKKDQASTDTPQV